MAVMGPIMNMQIPKSVGRASRNRGNNDELATPISEQDMYDDVDLSGRYGQAPRGEPQQGGSPIEALMGLLQGGGQGARILQAIQSMMGGQAQAGAPQAQMPPVQQEEYPLGPVQGPMPPPPVPKPSTMYHPDEDAQAMPDEEMLAYIAQQMGGGQERPETAMMTKPTDERLIALLGQVQDGDGLHSPEIFYKSLDAALQNGEINRSDYEALLQEYDDTVDGSNPTSDDLEANRSTRIDER